MAQNISSKYEIAFIRFAKCHFLYDSSSELSEKEIEDLGKNSVFKSFDSLYSGYFFTEKAINSFVEYYRITFPSATFIPKMHMMEDHIVPCVIKWTVGCGLMGEQGAELWNAKAAKIYML